MQRGYIAATGIPEEVTAYAEFGAHQVDLVTRVLLEV